MQKIAIKALLALALLVGVTGYIVTVCVLPRLANVMIQLSLFSGVIGVLVYLFEFALITLPIGLIVMWIWSRK